MLWQGNRTRLGELTRPHCIFPAMLRATRYQACRNHYLQVGSEDAQLTDHGQVPKCGMQCHSFGGHQKGMGINQTNRKWDLKLQIEQDSGLR